MQRALVHTAGSTARAMRRHAERPTCALMTAAMWRPVAPAASCWRDASLAATLPPCAAAPRSLHSVASRPLLLASPSSSAPALDAHSLAQAASWNLAARLGSADEVQALATWLASFQRAHIPANTFEVKHARSSGAGGQNVNKVNTKVDLRFRLSSASWLPPLARRCLGEAERARVNAAGELVVTSERTRTQGENLQDCIDKLHQMILRACELPAGTDEAKAARVTKMAKASKARRSTDKKFHSAKKAARRDWRE